MADGSVVSWGDRRFGGDSQWVQEQLINVKQLQSTSGAFASIHSDGTVVTWGNSSCGGDSREVQDQLRCLEDLGRKLALQCSTVLLLFF